MYIGLTCSTCDYEASGFLLFRAGTQTMYEPFQTCYKDCIHIYCIVIDFGSKVTRFDGAYAFFSLMSQKKITSFI